MEENKLEKELVQLVKEAVEFRESTRDREYLNNMAHYEGLQWELTENKNESPFLCKSDINHLKNAVDLRLGSLFSESYYGELQPLSPNDLEAIDVLNNIYRNEWSRLNADDFVEAAIKNGCLQDNGYTEVSFDEGAIFGGTGTRREGSIVLRSLSTSDVYLDPRATSIDDCEYIVVKSKKTKNWIKRHKKDWLEKLKREQLEPVSIIDKQEGNIYLGRDYGKSQTNLYVIDTVYRKYPEEIEVEVTDDMGNIVYDPETVVMDALGNVIEGTPIMEKVMVTRVKIHYLVGDTLLETDEEYPFDEFSIIPFQWEPIPQSPYGIPLLRGLTIPQKVANLIESAANNVALHYSTPSWLVSEESGLDINKVARLGNALGMVWKVSGSVNDAMKQMEYPDVNEQLIAIKESFVQNIKNYSGVNDVYMGNIGTAGSTAEGTNAAVNRATVVDNSPTSQIEKYVEKLSRMIIKFMTRYYKHQTIYIRDAQKNKNGKYTFKSFLMQDGYENINYDFDVKLAGRSKTDKNRQYNLMKDLYQLQNQYKEANKVINVPDLVKAAQLDNYDEMFKRYSNMQTEAFNEKANLIVQIMNIGGEITPNGQPLIPAELMQQGIIDVLDDNGDLSTVEQIFATYEEYQTQITALKNQMAANEQQAIINNAVNQNNQLQESMLQGVENMQQQAQEENALNEVLSSMGL
jgi:hypothetical protein